MKKAILILTILICTQALGQEAMRRWCKLNQVRQDKFDLVLPEAMRENNIGMWIVTNREGNLDPLYTDMGEGYVGGNAYYIFTDKGKNHIERAALGVSGYLLKEGGIYDYFGSAEELKDFVTERDPKTIGLTFLKTLVALTDSPTLLFWSFPKF